MAKTAKEILDKTNKITNPKSLMQQRTRGTFGAAFTGMTAGIVFGYVKNYNLITSAFLGALLGGLVAQIFLPKE
jgi:hypothetical protein